MEKEEFTFIQDQIGYQFKNLDLLQQAFVRRSYSQENGGEDNEVLEFIGDRALDIVVVKYLADTYGGFAREYEDFDADDDYDEFYCAYDESELSKIKQSLVCRKNLAKCIEKLELEEFLIMGESGIGKSEAALELIKRGHRLVTDDVVEIRKVSDDTLIGSAPDITKHFIELRGIAIVNVARVFGVGAVKVSESLDLVVQLEAWDPTKNYQRTGLESEYYDILGVNIPSTIIPVSPGRNLAVVLETAAINNRQKKMGYNAAKELLIRLGLNDTMD